MPRYVVPTDSRTERYWDVVAKLRPGAALAQAQAEMDGIARRQEADYPDSSQGWGIDVVPLRDHMAGEARRGILLLTVGTGMLLLIACANVATLLLARGMARRSEIAIRSALGAGRWRLVRQFLVEATVLAACAGLLGIVFAGVGGRGCAALVAAESTGAAGDGDQSDSAGVRARECAWDRPRHRDGTGAALGASRR